MQQISSIKDMKAIVRQSYLDKIAKHLGKDTIIIIVGQRRVGKSYTLRFFRDKKRNMSLPTFRLTGT